MIKFNIEHFRKTDTEDIFRIFNEKKTFFREYPKAFLFTCDLVKEDLQIDIDIQFQDFLKSDNVVKMYDNAYLEHTTQWRVKFTYEKLKEFYVNEFFEV